MRTLFAAFRSRIKRRQRSMLADESGVTAIEFGLLAFPFFAIIGAILQTSVIFLASQVLESAVQDAAREIRTGRIGISASADDFRMSVCDRLFAFFPDCAGLHVRVVDFQRFQDAQVIVPIDLDCDAPCDWSVAEQWSPGGASRTVVAQVHYRYPVVIQFGPLGMSNMGDGRRLLGAAAVFKNEPF